MPSTGDGFSITLPPGRNALPGACTTAQYTSEDFQRLLGSHGIVCSMSRRGNCWDNAAMESVFSTLKTERLSKKHYRTRDDLRADVFDYIERLYNPRRRHSTLVYISPVQFEILKYA